jgi:hypothetical protein
MKAAMQDKQLHIGGHIVYDGNENIIKLWTRSWTGRYYFGDLCIDVRMKLIFILKYIVCEFIFPH